MGQTGSHTGKLDIWLGKAHLLHICQVVEGIITLSSIAKQFEILGVFLSTFRFKIWIKSWIFTHLQPRANILFKKSTFDKVAKVCRKRGQNYSDSPKVAFGPKSTISTCRRRAWWKLRLISCCAKLQKPTPCLQISDATKFYDRGLKLTMSQEDLTMGLLLK